MDTKKIWKILDRERRLNYNTKAELGRKLGRSKSAFENYMKTLKECNERNAFNKICSVLEALGKRIIVVDENGNEIILN